MKISSSAVLHLQEKSYYNFIMNENDLDFRVIHLRGSNEKSTQNKSESDNGSLRIQILTREMEETADGGECWLRWDIQGDNVALLKHRNAQTRTYQTLLGQQD